MKDGVKAAFLALLGSLGMLGYAVDSGTLRGLAALTCASRCCKQGSVPQV